MSEFNTGDRVRVVNGKEDNPPYYGQEGTVVKNDGTDVWVKIDDEQEIGYYESNLELVKTADGVIPVASQRPVYFIVTTVGGSQFKSAEFDPSDPEDLALALAFRSGTLDGEVVFEDSQGREVNIPKGRLDNLIWYNLPTE